MCLSYFYLLNTLTCFSPCSYCTYLGAELYWGFVFWHFIPPWYIVSLYQYRDGRPALAICLAYPRSLMKSVTDAEMNSPEKCVRTTVLSALRTDAMTDDLPSSATCTSNNCEVCESGSCVCCTFAGQRACAVED